MDARRIGRTLLDVFLDRVASTPEGEATLHLARGHVVSTTWAEWHRCSRTLAAGLLCLGLEVGDRVAIYCSTRVEWAWVDMAVLMAGGVSVPIFPSESAAVCAELIRDSGARVVVAEGPAHVARLAEIRRDIAAVERVVYVDAETETGPGEVVQVDDVVLPGARAWLMGLDALRDVGEERAVQVAVELERRRQRVRPDTCATLAYTPGTEGQPKGVMQTHGNFVATSAALRATLEITSQDLQLLYLPLAQSFAHICLVTAIDAGVTTAYARSHRTVMADVRTFAPTFLCAVPSLFERVMASREQVVASAGWLEKTVAAWTTGSRVAADAAADSGLLGTARRALTERLVRKPMRELFGGRMRFAISGGAPLQSAVGEYFAGHGLPILEGYGLTETCAATHINRLKSCRFGTVGQPLAGVEARVGDDGEILVRGPNVTPGYWSRPTESEQICDAEGWLRTGDLGSIDAEGFLAITARKGEVIIPADGTPTAPDAIADLLRTDPLVGQALILGDGRPFLIALLWLDAAALQRFAKERGLDGSYEELTREPRVFAAVEAHVERVNQRLSAQDAIRKFAILSTPLTADSGDLTALQTVRRAALVEKHRALIESFYSEQY